jgi:hypothetical protein
MASAQRDEEAGEPMVETKGDAPLAEAA